MRRVDHELLNAKLNELGEGEDALIAVKSKTGLSLSLLYKLASGRYQWTPNNATRRLLAGALKVDEDDLFPLVKQEKAS